MTGPTRFRFLNRDGECAIAADWNDPAREKLWLYNLHYFDDLTAAGAAARASWHRDLIERWIAENPPTKGNGWEPYPTSLRIVNWIKWALGGNAPPAGFPDSLSTQARWLAKRVEHHLMANHLFTNAKALVLAGLYFEGDEAARWREQGLSILARELPAQILADGGHFERSPMYHALILEDLLDLINGARAYPTMVNDASVAVWRDAAHRMLGWARAMSHPDGQIAFFNDAAFDIAADHAALAGYASRLGVDLPAGPARLSDSGYVRAEMGDAVVIMDVGLVGPDHQPGHAHADTLSFELSVGGHRVFVNSGTSTYAPGPQRQRERSTAAHNTVEIDGKSSSEVWGGFRVARRARPSVHAVSENRESIVVRASHDGYHRLPGAPTHEREWRLAPGRLGVTDRIIGTAGVAIARLYLHPEVGVSGNDTLILRDGRRCRWSVRGGHAALTPAYWYPEFGRAEPNRCIEIRLDGAALTFEMDW